MQIEEAWAQLHAAADLAAARGSLLFHLDLATEVARAAFAARDIAAATLATLVDEHGYRVIAFDAAATPRALAEARFDRNGAAQVLPAPDRLPPRALTFADAVATVAATRFDGAATHAALVIPADDRRAPLEGYALAVGDDPDTAHLAGHWLLTLDPPGRRIIAQQPLAAGSPATCPVRTLRDTTLTIPGAVPNELHTCLSLKHGVPLLVETQESGARWRVDGERVRVAS